MVLYLHMKRKKRADQYLLSTSVQTLPEMYIQKTWRRFMCINMVHISFIPTTKKYGIISHSLRSLIVLQTAR